MIEVWHMRDNLTRDERLALMDAAYSNDLAPIKEGFNGGLYRRVALVNTNNCEVAWRYTNNRGEGSWSMEPDEIVTVMAPLHVVKDRTFGLKSSEVGDVFVQIDVPETEDRIIPIVYVVAPAGFKEII